MTKPVLTGLLAVICTSFITAQEMDTNVPMGWATYPKYGVENTIGGGDGELVTARTYAELADYAKRKEPLVIIAEGSFTGDVVVEDNKTIVGSGSGASLKGGFLLHQKGNNVIIRNWKITGGMTKAPIAYMEDAVAISGVHHVWVDHCDLSNCIDGLLDITNGSDLVTASWIKFYSHNKVLLIQNGIENADEVDKLNVTIHHLYFNGTTQRHPRVGYGDVHILNNYYVGCKEYAIHLFWECRVYIERNYFKNVNDAISQHQPNAGKSEKLKLNWDGYAILVDNKLDNSNQKMTNTTDDSRIFKVDDYYMYDWVVDDVNSVPEIVGNGAGTGSQWSTIGAIPTPGQGAVNVSANPSLKWTKVGSQASNKVYFGKTLPPPEVTTIDGYEYKPGTLDQGTVYYWKINDGKVWKFRTQGTPVGVKQQNTKKSSQVTSRPSLVNIQPGISKKLHSNIGVKTSDNPDGIFLLNGKETPHQGNNPVKK